MADLTNDLKLVADALEGRDGIDRRLNPEAYRLFRRLALQSALDEIRDSHGPQIDPYWDDFVGDFVRP